MALRFGREFRQFGQIGVGAPLENAQRLERAAYILVEPGTVAGEGQKALQLAA